MWERGMIRVGLYLGTGTVLTIATVCRSEHISQEADFSFVCLISSKHTQTSNAQGSQIRLEHSHWV